VRLGLRIKQKKVSKYHTLYQSVRVVSIDRRNWLADNVSAIAAVRSGYATSRNVNDVLLRIIYAGFNLWHMLGQHVPGTQPWGDSGIPMCVLISLHC
jgi:hypothetical protein